MIELYDNFFDMFCDIKKFEELEMDNDSLYMALPHENLYECIRPEMKSTWKELRSNDCVEIFCADCNKNFFPRNCCPKDVKHDKREPGLFKEEFRFNDMLSLCSKT